MREDGEHMVKMVRSQELLPRVGRRIRPTQHKSFEELGVYVALPYP